MSAFEEIKPLFSIGLSNIASSKWLEIDGRRDEYLAVKSELHRTRLDDVFAAEEGTEASQLEVLKLVQAFLLENSGLSATWREEEIAPLMQAASMIQEDLALMRKDGAGWRLVAASVCFPSNWWLREKMGLPLAQVHHSIPGFGPESRNDEIIGRIFDSMQVGSIVERRNWSLVNTDKLPHWPDEKVFDRQREYPQGVFMRVERQTLRKLAACGDILFTIRIHIESLNKLHHHREGGKISRRLAEELGRLSEAELRYKGLYGSLDHLMKQLEQIYLG